ncbi:DNA repair protein RecO [Corticibacter populi]|uniref:DNA repair protein RecO n=1 Tax=Corticibacter populi TaxID=1550736 RepID=A0A3M6R0U9_9BURK|nr:DNA repair protein RecO [Corticibacter populi]RMX08878.1 DNA repair protein RecO [Corticibacter populi]
MQRASGHQAFVLHHYPYSESSAIVELLTRERGRISAIAKGAKKPTSNFRAVLLPLQAVRVDYSFVENEGAEICSIRAIERSSGPAMPSGDALLAGLYLNELLMRMLVRAEPQAAIFDAFAATVRVLASDPGPILEALLRSFELVLLRQLGMLPDLSVQTLSQTPIEERRRYALVPEVGLHEAPADGRALPGSQWLALQQALASEQALAGCMRILGENATGLKQQLRAALAHYLGGELQTQRLMRGLRAL